MASYSPIRGEFFLPFSRPAAGTLGQLTFFLLPLSPRFWVLTGTRRLQVIGRGFSLSGGHEKLAASLEHTISGFDLSLSPLFPALPDVKEWNVVLIFCADPNHCLASYLFVIPAGPSLFGWSWVDFLETPPFVSGSQQTSAPSIAAAVGF